MKSIGIAMLGYGFAARFHAENYKRVHGIDVRLTGVYGRRPNAAAEFASAYGFEKTYATLDEVLQDPTVDLVDACVPTSLHEDIAVTALNAGKHVVIEKPLSGSFVRGDDEEGWRRCLSASLESADRMIEAERSSGKRIMYAENWVYAPGIQKAKRLLASAQSPILRIVGEESHSGTHSPYQMQWKTAGGGSLLVKGCHPLGGALYLKSDEGMRRLGRPVRPVRVTGAVANLTKSEAFESEQDHNIRTGWVDCEDWGTMVVTFDDGTVAQITAADTALGGIQNVMTVYAGRATVQIGMSPNTSVVAYSPDDATFSQEYVREKVETTAGWQFTNPDEDWINGFPHEMQDFCQSVIDDRPPESGSSLGRDVLAVTYAAYLSAATGREVKVPLD